MFAYLLFIIFGYRPENFSIKWTDNDGDDVTIASAEEYRIAINHPSKKKEEYMDKILKIKVAVIRQLDYDYDCW